jgi:signal transduction histidine kinase
MGLAKEWVMNRVRKLLSSIGLGQEFIGFFGKLLFLWNPLWTLLWTVASILFLGKSGVIFTWVWNLSEATLVGLFGMAVIGVFLALEKAWGARTSWTPPQHGTGWFLLFLAFLTPAGLYLALHVMVWVINLTLPGAPMHPDFRKYYGKEIFEGWVLLLACFLFKHWQDLRDTAQRAQLRAEELEKERLQALLTKLKDQMNPHFLFNTLNTVASLIHDDPAKAEKVVVRLSTLFQGVLSATRKSTHSLEKELEFCRDYLDIEQVRFGKRLVVKMEIKKTVDPGRLWVPVLLLQPMVENAIKHGLSSRASGGRLWIGAELREGHLELRVEDDGVGFGHSPYAGSGTALENCRKRLELSYGKEGRIEIQPREGGGTKVLLVMPVITAGPPAQEEK